MTQIPYRHSETFAKLKRLQETIPHNLTSVEYLKTLDYLLENALYPVLISTKFVDTFLSKILAWQSTNPKRKTSAEGKKDLPSYVTLYLISNTAEQKLKIYNKIGFDRGITMEIIRRWLDLMKTYETLINIPEPDVDQIEKTKRYLIALGSSDDDYPYGAYLQVSFWFEKANYFKSLILEKYTRLCLNTAQQDYVKFQHRIDLEDIIQVYLMAASKAIDKCNPNKGVLTTHIQHWLMSARNTVVKNYLGDNRVEKVKIPESHTVVEKLISDDIHGPSEKPEPVLETIEDKMERQGTIDRVRQIAKVFDPKGYARLLMGVGEYMTPKMFEALKGATANANRIS